MANELKKITALTAGTPLDTDVIPYVDLVTGTTKKALKSELKGDTGETGATGATGATGPAGADGDNAYVYIAYASADDGTGFTMTFDADLDYIAIKNSATEIVSPQASDFTGLWKNYKGATGDTGPTGPAGDGDVNGPATNTADYIPQWNGANSKTLKDGLAVPAGGLAGLTALGEKAPIASPTFTGTVTTPAIKITTGASLGKVLTSDADGDATWETSTGVLTSTTVNITSNQIKALNSSPVTLIAGVAGQIVELISVVAVFNYGTTQYTAGGTLRIKEETTGAAYSPTAVLSAAQINGTADIVVTYSGRGSTNALSSTPGKGILLNAETQNFATGDGTIDIHLVYRMVTV